MPASIYVLGHKNPDTDSICSAIGYAALLQAQGQPGVPGRQGGLRRETAYVLERFGVAPPLLVTDVRPRVADVMTSPAVTVHQDTPIYEVGQILQHQGIRAVPVLDDGGQLVGVTGIEDFARSFIAGLEINQLDRVPVDLENVVRALDGTLLVDATGRTLQDQVMVGAMRINSMLKRISPNIVLVMGDRLDAQRAAIEYGVGALVITGGLAVAPEILELARARQVTIISVPHHTYTTVRLIHLSTAVRHIMRRSVVTCRPDDFVDDVRDTLRDGPVRALVVAREDGSVAGLISRTNLLRQIRRQVVLVDHNERGQAVGGIEEAEIIGVIDHHRVADLQTRIPPFIRFDPVGSTSTIVAKLFAEAGLEIPPPIAGVLLSGILADTLVFRGPTTTAEDQRVADALAARAAVDLQELGDEILRRASDVSDRSAEEILKADFKDFSVDEAHFGIGTIETTHGAEVLARRDELLAAMERLRQQGYTSVIFAVIDIGRAQTTLLVAGHPDAVAATFNAPLADGVAVPLPGILSRKKNIVPQLGSLARATGPH